MFQKVHKFGGSSLADGKSFQNVCRLLREDLANGEPIIVVVSASLGVTDALYGLWSDRSSFNFIAESLKTQQIRLIKSLLLEPRAQGLIDDLEKDFASLREELFQDRAREADVVTRGEIWSARLLRTLLHDLGIESQMIDPRKFLAIHGDGRFVNADQARNIFRQLAGSSRCLVVPGFLAVNAFGETITLDRGGSDYSAGLLTALFGATELHIWTDVEGIRSADPDCVKQTTLLPALSINEARRFARFGAGVLHPRTLDPLLLTNETKVYVRSSLKPKSGKTLIELTSDKSNCLGLTSLAPCTLIRIQKQDFNEFKSVLARFSPKFCFQIEQEQSIFLMIPQSASSTIFRELQIKLPTIWQRIDVQSHMTLISAIYGDLFDRVHSLPLQTDSLPFGIEYLPYEADCVDFYLVHQRLAKKAMIYLHEQIMHREKSLAVALIGVGQVGRTLLNQIQSTTFQLRSQVDHSRFVIKALANSKKMLLAHDGIDLEHWQTELSQASELDLDQLTEHMENFGPDAVMIDVTASAEVAQMHRVWLSKGLHVITANKISCSGDHYDELVKLGKKNRVQFLFETTVGAGLPVIQVAKNLVESGDRFIELNGILSGSLSYLFQKMEEGYNFSETVRLMQELGLAEPDPRIDLSGCDVARKLMILARQFHINLCWDEIEIQPVLPELDECLSPSQFLAQLESYDTEFLERQQLAKSRQSVLRYVAHLSADGQARVGLVELPKDHGFASLNPADNVIQFTTERYHQNPLIVRGPGAGLEVTAAGLLNDLMRISH